MKSFESFDGRRIAYLDEGKGPAVVLLHGFGVDGRRNFGNFDELLPVLEKSSALFQQQLGFAPPMPKPPLTGRTGLIASLVAMGARVVVPDMRGFGASDKPRETAAYVDSAMARDMIALIEYLKLEAVDVLGFSMGAVTAAKLLILGVRQVRSAILSGIGDYIMAGVPMDLPKDWPLQEHLPKPLTLQVHAMEGAKVLDRGEIVPGNLMSGHVIVAKAMGADLKALAAALRGEMAEQVTAEQLSKVSVPVLVLNGTADVANRAVHRLLAAIPTARFVPCDGDHGSTPFEPTFQQVACDFFRQRWQAP
jgi:pimeloyl-ACP methyl ester carboxylesterase